MCVYDWGLIWEHLVDNNYSLTDKFYELSYYINGWNDNNKLFEWELNYLDLNDIKYII